MDHRAGWEALRAVPEPVGALPHGHDGGDGALHVRIYRQQRHVAVDQLAGTINWRRQTTRKPVYRVVGFSDVLWSKKWGLQRAYFVPVRWVEPDLGIENASPDTPQLNSGGTFADTVKTIEETVASATLITEEMDKQLG